MSKDFSCCIFLSLEVDGVVLWGKKPWIAVGNSRNCLGIGYVLSIGTVVV